MSIFDKLRGQLTPQTTSPKATEPASKKETFSFAELPESLAQLQALPEAALTSPFQTAALTVCALCAYGAEPAVGIEMLNWLKGPPPPDKPRDLIFEGSIPRRCPRAVFLLCRRNTGQ